MRTEAEIINDLNRSTSLQERQELVRELDQFRAARSAKLRSDRELDISGAVIRDTLTPVIAYQRTSEDTDWIHEVATPAGNYDHAMRTEATLWFRKVSTEVKEDREEFGEQAMGIARRVSGQFGIESEAAYRAFLDQVARLWKRSGKFEESRHRHQAEIHTAGFVIFDGVGYLRVRDARYGPGEEWIEDVSEASVWSQRSDAQLVANVYNATVVEMPFYEAERKTGDDKPGEVDEEQSGNAESTVTDYDTKEDQEPWLAEDWPEESDTGDGYHPPMPGAGEGSNTVGRRKRGQQVGERVDIPSLGSGEVTEVEVDGNPNLIRVLLDSSGTEHVVDKRRMALKRAAEGQTCATCGDSIERDPEGEEPRTWHHTSGGSHDHEASPSGDSKESQRKRAVTYGELPDTGTGQPQPNMACVNEGCVAYGEMYSAERGDYFWADSSETVTCSECGNPMAFVQSRSGFDILSQRGSRRRAVLDAFGEWMVRSNLRRIEEEGLDPSEVVAVIRANGYPSVADAVEQAIQSKESRRKTADTTGPIVFDDPVGARYCAIEVVGLGSTGDYSGVRTATKRIVGVGAREIFVCDEHVPEGVEYVRTGEPYWTASKESRKVASQWYDEGFARGKALADEGVSLADTSDPLSGEWAGESIPEIFGSWEEATEEAMEDYEEGYWAGVGSSLPPIAGSQRVAEDLDTNEVYAIRDENGVVVFTYVYKFEKDQILADNPGWTAERQMGIGGEASKKRMAEGPPWMPQEGDRVKVSGEEGMVIGKDMPGFYTIRGDDGWVTHEVSRDDMTKVGAREGIKVGSLIESRAKVYVSRGSRKQAEYQGWINEETWSVALWFNNEFDHYQATRGFTEPSQIEQYARANFSTSFTFAGEGGFDWDAVSWSELIEEIQSE